MTSFNRMVKAQVAEQYRSWVREAAPEVTGFVSCQGWYHHLCPMDKMVRPGKVRCIDCWRELRDAKKENTAAKKAVADIWAKFEAPPTSWPQIDSSDDEE